MIKKIASICLILMMILLVVPTAAANEIKNNNDIEITSLDGITLEDDAFHKTYNKFHAETWYFDAIFTNGYSMAVIVTVAQKGDAGSVLTGLYIYKDTELIYRPRTFYDYDQLSISEKKLDMKIKDETIMKCDIDSDGRWNYYVYENFDNVQVELNFINMTEGWRTDITGGWWLVSPRLEVTGSIILEGETIDVEGEGYHDHNWFYANTPLMQEGWHFGNIVGDTLGITWANVLNDGAPVDTIVVLNQKGTKPIMVDSNDVDLTVVEYIQSNGKTIPSKFTIEINNDDFHVDLYIEILNYNYVSLPMLSYWRFHKKITGTISYKSISEDIDNIGIAELMKFYRIDDDSTPKNTKNIEISKPLNTVRLNIIKLNDIP